MGECPLWKVSAPVLREPIRVATEEEDENRLCLETEPPDNCCWDVVWGSNPGS